MRLDHVSYVASHDQISDVVNRIGSQIGTAFVDGGMHPKFGTRNFTAPLLNGQYIEVVCPMDHPATDSTPFGQLVKQKAEDGGGWLTWVVRTEKISEVELRLDRKAIEGDRRTPNGTILKWKQIGILTTISQPSKPFFVEWLVDEHPSKTSEPSTGISKIIFNAEKKEIKTWLGTDLNKVLGNIETEWVTSDIHNQQTGILRIEFTNNGHKISID